MVIEMIEHRLDAGHLPLVWRHNELLILDQRVLPEKLEYFKVGSFADTCFAIKDMVVRGAPSIGVTAVYGFALEACRVAANSLLKTARESQSFDSYDKLFPLPSTLANLKIEQTEALTVELAKIKNTLDATRPTAVNLRWGTDRMYAFCSQLLLSKLTLGTFAESALNCAQAILNEHIEINIKLSNHGLSVVPPDANFITHCNAGPLAACGWGTALGVIRSAFAAGRNPHVYVDETRPRNQGAKLTIWELMQDKIPATLVCDNMSGFLMTNKKIDLVVVGADRIARNGDTANKIGTFNLAMVAAYHKVPFYVAAPLSTFDATIFNGIEIPIEERNSNEITELSGVQALNPAFDVTPNELIAGIITEAGILRAPYNESITRALGI